MGLRIAILSSGRFHLCDLARELHRLGHEVSFYTLVPAYITRRYGLPDSCHRWLAPWVAPVYAGKLALRKTRYSLSADRVLLQAVDWVASKTLAPCDVFIGLSGLAVESLESAKRRYHARTYLERGSRHIESQREILDALQPPAPGKDSAVPDWVIERETAGYALADFIALPSRHAVASFVERNVPTSKLFRNPYGTDLSMFPPTLAPSEDTPATLLNVGAFSRQKGSDVLVEGWKTLRQQNEWKNARLIHVGAVGDVAIPALEGFSHHDAVPQHTLSQKYAQGHVFALPSFQEGLALVQAQALASGLHLIGSNRSGAEDLAELLELEEEQLISTVDVGSPASRWAEAFGLALEKAKKHKGLRDFLGPKRGRLSWEEYALRYDAHLRSAR